MCPNVWVPYHACNNITEDTTLSPVYIGFDASYTRGNKIELFPHEDWSAARPFCVAHITNMESIFSAIAKRRHITARLSCAQDYQN